MPDTAAQAPASLGFLGARAGCAGLIADKDWSETKLGPIEDWPQCLKTATALVLQSPVPLVMLWGADGVMLYNEAYAQFAGGRHPELLGAEVRQGWPEAAEFNDNVMRVGLAGDTLQYRDQKLTLLRHGRPEHVWMDLDYSPVLDETGVPAGVICILNETTGRVEAERHAAFLLSLSDAMRSLDDPSALLALATQRLGAELGASRVFYATISTEGWMTVEQDHAVGVASIVGVHSLKSFGSDLLRAYRAGAPVVVRDVQADDRLSDGARSGLQTREVSAFIDVVLFQEEQWVGLLAVQSATPRYWTSAEEALAQAVGERLKTAIERARAERALRDLKDTLEKRVIEATSELVLHQHIVQSNPGPILAFDHDLRIIAFNKPHADRFFETQGAPSYIGQRFPDYFIAEEQPQITALMQRALSGETFTTRVQFGDPAFARLHWDLTHGPLLDSHGVIVGGFHHAIEITAQVEAERLLAESQEALRHSQKMEAMGQLTGGVAHDFNNLLTPIVGSLDLLQRRGIGGDREQRLIAGALQSADRAKTLVQRLLAFARRQPLQARPVDVAALVMSMDHLVASTSGPTIQVEFDIDVGLPRAFADANQIEMAILNLAVNARDAMPDGGRLTISATADRVGEGQTAPLAPGRYVRLSVEDTGVGMDDDTLRRAIEPFFSTKGIGKGTGLGLSMVHGLAAQLGGTLTVASTPGLGTRVELWLPTTDAEVDPVRAVMAIESPARSGTALVVDDEDIVRTSTADMLADLGYAVVEASSAEAALLLIEGGLLPDLLVTDHLMPGMSGADLVRRIAAAHSLPALIISGYAEVDGIAPDLPRLMKPFRQIELLDAIAALSTSKAVTTDLTAA
ncbi:signal transduction histidine kinase [Brevundimonas vesicularis]|uniref:GAF domain-containing hybrid sensor histidine kinase/response regulator n=1 Tax=Brevundimonas vesicularis TaxID=41276 RepID=UPI002780CFB2|nr:PAS domain-containing protein [Brevundimonas vesicularis]MDQ1193825.1 signal transduction histidine kinase [Brevundimonas vesicularis]